MRQNAPDLLARAVWGSLLRLPEGVGRVWRALDELSPARLRAIGRARARVRRYVRSQFPGGLPASVAVGAGLGADLMVLDVDAAIVVAHGERENAAASHPG